MPLFRRRVASASRSKQEVTVQSPALLIFLISSYRESGETIFIAYDKLHELIFSSIFKLPVPYKVSLQPLLPDFLQEP